jgi:hypothetical protein
VLYVAKFFVICGNHSLWRSHAGKMHPQRTVTRRSPRTPKGKELEVGEGSSPAVAKELEFAPKAKTVIQISTKKQFIQPPTFRDTEASTASKVLLPPWGDLYNKIH